MRKKAVTGLILIALLAIIMVVGYWLTHSNAGRDFALKQAQAALPEGSSLQWKSVTGQIANGLQFEKLVYADATQRFEVGSLELNIKLSPLLFRKVHSDFVNAKHLRIYLAKDDTPFEFPRWPESLPALDVPVSVLLKKGHIEDVQFFKDKVLVYALNSLDGSMQLKPGSLQLNDIKAQSADGTINLSGYYQPNHGFATKLKGGVRLNVVGAAKPQNLRFSADGNAQRFLLDVQGAMPKPISIRWQLQDQDQKPFWFLSASTERFEPRLLGLVDEHAYRIQLAASGNDTSTQLAGELSRDAETIVINPSNLSLHNEDIRLDKLQIEYGGGLFTATGALTASEQMSSKGLNLTIAHFALPIAQQDTAVKEPPVVLNSQLTLSGSLQKWMLRATGDLLRGKESATFSLAGTGSQQAVSLSTLSVKTAKGGLTGKLQAQWQPTLDVAFEGTLNQFDPSYFYADYPGAINADLKFAAKQAKDKPWQGALVIKKLGGQLRSRALAGQADIQFEGLKIAGNADLKAGSSHVLLKGSDGAQLDVAAQLLPLNLSDINPNWTGLVNGKLLLKGTRINPLYDVQLLGENITLLDYRAKRIRLQGNTISGNRTQLQANGVLVSGQPIEQVQAELIGKLSDAQLVASIQAADFSASSAGRLQWTDSKQAYNAQTFQIQGQEFGVWQLQAPMQIQLTKESYAFSRICLANSNHSARVCAEDAGTAIAINGSDFPLFLLEPWLNNAGKEFTYTGSASMKGELPKNFTLTGTGFVNLQVPFLKIGVKPNADNFITQIDALNLEAQWIGQRITAKVSAKLPQMGFIEGHLNTGFADNAPLSGELKAQIVDLDWLELFSLDIAQPKGHISGDLVLAGTRAAPLINGSYVLKDFNVQIPALGLKLSDGQLTAKSTNNLALLIKGSIKSGEGRMVITGLWDPADQLEQPINLRLIGKNFALADTPNMQLTANTDVILTYEKGIYAIDGELNLLKGLINLESIDSEIAISNDVVVLDPVPEKSNRDLLKLGLKLKVAVNEQVKVNGFGLIGSAEGNVLVNSPYDSPTKLTGTLKLLGKYESYGQKLQIKRGDLIYSNSLMTEPRLDVLTERYIEDEDITVGLEITGYASNPRTRVVSDPAMSDSEALSWMLFGRPLNSVNSSQAQAINTKSMALNAGGTLLVGTLGKQIGLDQASISDSRALGDSTLTIGKQLSPKFFVSYGVSLLGIGQIITLKYLLQKGLDITIETEQSDKREQSSAALNWRK
jgi:translocation and assembly module TamB